MKHIFYLMTIVAIMYEGMVILSPRKTTNFVKGAKGKKFDDYTDTQKSFGVCSLLYLIWDLVGLLSSQWLVFLFLLLFSFIPKPYPALRFVDAIISLLVLVFMLVNVYHLHIDLFQFVLKLFA